MEESASIVFNYAYSWIGKEVSHCCFDGCRSDAKINCFACEVIASVSSTDSSIMLLGSKCGINDDRRLFRYIFNYLDQCWI